MLYLLWGEDDFSIHQSLEEIKKGIGDETALMTNTTLLNGQQVTLAQLKHACETVPFLAEKRLVIVEGLLERFEPRDKSRRKKTVQPADSGNGYEPVAAYTRQVPDFTVLVILGGNISDRNPLLRECRSAGAKIRSFPLLRNTAKLSQWIRERVSAQGGSISSEAIGLLAEFVGGNLWAMANEIDKLMLFASGRRIEGEDARLVVSYVQEANIFAMADAILELRMAAAQEQLQRLLQQGVHPAGILVIITRQVRILVQVRELTRQGMSRMDIQGKLGMTSEFVIRKALEQASRYSMARLTEVYHHLLETDLAIKTGRYDGELALGILIAELCQRQKLGTV